MERAILAAVIFLFTAQAAVVTFKDSYIFSHVDFAQKIYSLPLSSNDEWSLYCSSSGADDFNRMVEISASNDSGNQRDNVTMNHYSTPDIYGRLIPFTIKAGLGNLKITINSDIKTLPAMFFYLVKQKSGAPRVYDVTRSNSNKITTDAALVNSAATFLSAKPYFTLSAFDIGSSSTVKVYPSGWDAIDNNDKVDSILAVSSKQFASRSFVTIFGPIATVHVTKFDISKFSVNVDNSALPPSSFTPGAAFSAVSPGYIAYGNNQLYPSLYNGSFHFDWTVSNGNEVPLTYDVRTGSISSQVKVTTIGSNSKVETTYQRDASQTSQATVKEITVDCSDAAAANPVFLVRITSIGCSLSISYLLLAATVLYAWRN